MLATDNPTFLLKAHHFSPEDVETIRHAFQRACGENPLIAATAAQRSDLAKAIVDIYQPYLPEIDLIAAALHWKK
jgi:hypothetical protein